MIKDTKHIRNRFLGALLLNLIIFAFASVFDTALSNHYDKASEACSISQTFDYHSDAVLTNAFSHHLDWNHSCINSANQPGESNQKYCLLHTDTKITTAYKLNCRTHLNLKPILHTYSQLNLSDYLPSREYPSIS